MSVLLFPANPLADGPGGLWLRSRTPTGIDLVSLLGQNAPTTPLPGGATPADRYGRFGDLTVTVGLRLGEQATAWFWHVSVTNGGPEPAEVDLVHVQDVALAPRGAVRACEYYVSQYLDLTPIEVPRHGTAIAVRQNMPGPTPVAARRVPGDGRRLGHRRHPADRAGAGRGRAVAGPAGRAARDTRAGRAQRGGAADRADGARARGHLDERVLRGVPGRPPGRHDGPGRPARRGSADRPGGPMRPEPTLLRPEPTLMRPEPDEGPGLPDVANHQSLFGTAAPFPARPLTEQELDQLAGPTRAEVERDGPDLLSFFTPTADMSSLPRSRPGCCGHTAT